MLDQKNHLQEQLSKLQRESAESQALALLNQFKASSNPNSTMSADDSQAKTEKIQKLEAEVSNLTNKLITL